MPSLPSQSRPAGALYELVDCQPPSRSVETMRSRHSGSAASLRRSTSIGSSRPVSFRPSTGAAAVGRGRERAVRPSCIDEPNRVVEVSLPPRRYDLAADIMATALGRLGHGSGVEAAGQRRSRTRHRRRARRLVASQGRVWAAVRSLAWLVDVLRGAGFEPDLEADGRVCLRNCPYEALTADHRDLTCGMNLAWAEGVVDGLAVPKVKAELAPEPGRCCVVFGSDT